MNEDELDEVWKSLTDKEVENTGKFINENITVEQVILEECIPYIEYIPGEGLPCITAGEPVKNEAHTQPGVHSIFCKKCDMAFMHDEFDFGISDEFYVIAHTLRKHMDDIKEAYK